jgi:hypothetical protein
MKRILRPLGVSLLLVVTGCDGGSSGTGIGTTALGNVASVSTALRRSSDGARPTAIARLFAGLGLEGEALALGTLESIRVSIEGTTLSTQTDAAGQFLLRGNFAGPAAMVFDLPEGGQASLVVVVPRGGELTLSNVHIDARTGRATTDTQRVRFGGLVDGTDCPRDSASMVSRATPNDGNTYTVLLDSATVRDQNGNSLTCASLSAGQSADVDGEVRADGNVQARSVEVEHESGEGGGGGSSGGGGTSGSGHDGDGGEGSKDGGGTSGSGGEGGESSGKGGGESGGDGSGSGGEGSGHN